MPVKLSIITCTLNSEEHLREAIISVKNQTYSNYEHVFIDGGSTDLTIEIIREFYEEPLLYVGNDKGVYDAFNRGMIAARGDVIGFVHSDDMLIVDDVFESVARAFEQNASLGYYCANVVMYNPIIDQFLPEMKPYLKKPGLIEEFKHLHPYSCHPAYYVRRSVIERLGLFRLDFRFVSDADWLDRLIRTNVPFFHDDRSIYLLRTSGTTGRNLYRVNSEALKMRIALGEFWFRPFNVYIYHTIRLAMKDALGFLRMYWAIELAARLLQGLWNCLERKSQRSSSSTEIFLRSLLAKTQSGIIRNKP